ILAAPDFFAASAVGINCQSGFLVFDRGGQVRVLPHDPQHRACHVWPGSWDPKYDDVEFVPPPGSLLEGLLNGSFFGDGDAIQKQDLLAEMAGGGGLGESTRLAQPKAIILLGGDADNGKSQLLFCLKALLPSNAVTSIPAHMLTNEH